MKLASILSLTILLVTGASTLPAADADLSEVQVSGLPLGKRQTVNSLPASQPVCDGYVTTVTNIQLGIQKAITLKAAGQTTGKDQYPHVFNNDPTRNGGITLSFPNCKGSTLYEYPLGRTQANPYNGGPNNKPGTSNPDRVVFTIDSTSSGTYCGVMTHSGAAQPGYFVSCT